MNTQKRELKRDIPQYFLLHNEQLFLKKFKNCQFKCRKTGIKRLDLLMVSFAQLKKKS